MLITAPAGVVTQYGYSIYVSSVDVNFSRSTRFVHRHLRTTARVVLSTRPQPITDSSPDASNNSRGFSTAVNTLPGNLLLLLVVILCVQNAAAAQPPTEFPDIRSVSEDLRTPAAQHQPPAAGRRVFLRATGDQPTGAQPSAILMLPENWSDDAVWPIFVELPGNGGYRDPRGDECSGKPEDCNLGYGLTAGRDWIWLCLPFLNDDGTKIAETWWGDPPKYNSASTLQFWKSQLDLVVSKYSGDPRCIVLAGFSRGAIAVNALGLRDPELSGRWTAFFPCSHYDGVRRWPFPDSDSTSARERLQRLNGRPQLISGEGNQVEETRKYLTASGGAASNVQFLPTGFRNHSDRWVLRPSTAREAARKWLQSVGPRDAVANDSE